MTAVKGFFTSIYYYIKTFFVWIYTSIKTKIKNFNFDFLDNINSLFYWGLLLVIVGIGFYAYSLFTEYWTVPYGGDYTQQQIPLYYNGYDTWMTFFKTGEFVLWDNNVFLGVDNIGSNSFYYLFDPFFFPVLLFPRHMVPQAMAIIMILKMVCAGFAFRYFIKYLGVRESTARVFGLAYAFVGWTAFYLWFNHFMAMAVYIPLVLLGIEKVIRERKPWLLMFSLAITGVTNYFFFAGFCIFGVMYALFRFFQSVKTRDAITNYKVMGLGIVSFAVGILLCSPVLIPGLITSLSSERASSDYLGELMAYFKDGDIMGALDIMFFDWSSRYTASSDGYGITVLYPLASFFYPTSSNRIPTLFTGPYDTYGSSLFIYTMPIVMFFMGLIYSFKEKRTSHVISITLFTLGLFTPFAYFMFSGFTDAYGRWEIFVMISLMMYAALMFDRREEFKRGEIALAGVMTFCLSIITLVVAQNVDFDDSSSRAFNEMAVPLIIYQIVMIVVVSCLLLGFYKKKYVTKIFLLVISIEAIVMGTSVQIFQGTIPYSSIGGNEYYVNIERDIFEEIDSVDDSFYRIQSRLAYLGNENLPMIIGYNGVSTFHSLYNYNVDDFMRMSRIFKASSTWIGGTIEKRYNLDAFLGVKYYFIYNADTRVDGVLVPANVPYGYNELTQFNQGVRVFENTNHIELGFSYDTLYFKGDNEDSDNNSFYSSWDTSAVITAEEAYLTGAILDDKDVETISEDYPGLITSDAPAMTATQLAVNYSIYECPFGYSFSPADPSEYLTSGEKVSSVSRNNPYLLELTPSIGTTFSSSQEAYYMLDYTLQTIYNADIFLIGESGNVIAMDNHTNSNMTYRWKTIRGFYSTEELAKILIIPKGSGGQYNTLASTRPPLYVETSAQIDAKLDVLRSYPLENISSKENTHRFTTDFDKNRMIVLQIPYDKGWSVTARDNVGNEKQLDVYNGQGGFVSFVSETGQTSYTVNFVSEGLNEGLLLFAGGIAIFGGSAAWYGVCQHKKNLKKKQAEETENN